MSTFTRKATLAALLVLLAAGGAWARVYAPPRRPVLYEKQGSTFAWSVPAGWRSHDTSNGVDMASPDGGSGAWSVLLYGGWGQATPRSFYEWTARKVGVTNLRYLSMKTLRPIPNAYGAPWQTVTAEVEYTFRGRRERACYISMVTSAWGRFSGVLQGYASPVERWSRERYWLPALVRSVRVVNSANVAMQSQILPARNIPLDYVYGSYQRDWYRRGVTMSRISQAREEATLGYERMKDPQTGRLYNMPLEAYDPTVGGYRVPVPGRRNELLVRPRK